MGQIDPKGRLRVKKIILHMMVFLLSDVNDHSPVFVNETLNMHLMENSENGTIIGQIQATDEDLGKFAKLQFSKSLTGSRQLKFETK